MRLFIIFLLLQSLAAQAQDLCIELQDLERLPDTIPRVILENRNNPTNQSRTTPGGWSGNGGDFGEVSDNIWNLGNHEIPFCVLSSPNFTLNKNSQIEMIEKSFTSWKTFFKKYDLLNPLLRESRSRRHGLSFTDGKNRAVNFNYKFTENCSNAKLRFYFGIENKVISEYKKYATEHPYGFALRTSYDHSTYTNTGLIWIKASTDLKQINEVLLHEIGHVLGMQHDSVYIMRSTMAADIEKSSNQNLTNQIETQSWPYRFLENSSIFLKTVSNRKQSPCSQENSFNMGREAKFISSILAVKSTDCLRLELKSTGYQRKELKLEYRLNNLTTGTSVLLNGTFASKRRTLGEKKGPGIFSKFKIQSPRGEKLVWRKISLDRFDNSEISGSFQSKEGSIPAKLIQEKGAVLDIYLPKSDRWITFRSVN